MSRYNRVKKNQLDAQLILSIFRQPLHVSGVSRPIMRYWLLRIIISTNCYINMVVPPDGGPRYAWNIQRLTKYTKNKLCIKLVFLYTTQTPADSRQIGTRFTKMTRTIQEWYHYIQMFNHLSEVKYNCADTVCQARLQTASTSRCKTEHFVTSCSFIHNNVSP
jgi:hypothetical protein